MHIRQCFGVGALILALGLAGMRLPAFMSPASAQAEEGVARIAFVTWDISSGAWALNMADPSGANVVTLVEDGYFSSPAWSPDGRQLAFIGHVRPYDDPALWLMNSDGSNLHAVISPGPTVPDPACAVWSPDGTQFLFGAEAGIGGYYFYTIGADGSGLERHPLRGVPGTMQGVPGDVISPCTAWSPDGSSIGVLGRGSGFPPGQLYLTSRDGTTAAAFPANRSSGDSFQQLAWSPDGTLAVVAAIPGLVGMDSEPMAITSADGLTILAWLGAPPNLAGSTAWSPDSRQIVFVANEQGVESMPGGDLWVANADGTGVHTLGITPNIANVGTSWGLIPADVALPSVPVSLAEAAG